MPICTLEIPRTETSSFLCLLLRQQGFIVKTRVSLFTSSRIGISPQTTNFYQAYTTVSTVLYYTRRHTHEHAYTRGTHPHTQTHTHTDARVCDYACLCAHARARVFVCVVCGCAWVCVCMYVSARECVRVSTSTCAHVCACVHACAYV